MTDQQIITQLKKTIRYLYRKLKGLEQRDLYLKYLEDNNKIVMKHPKEVAKQYIVDQIKINNKQTISSLRDFLTSFDEASTTKLKEVFKLSIELSEKVDLIVGFFKKKQEDKVVRKLIHRHAKAYNERKASNEQ